jgi:4-hydroxythreonine-4-phosphate dehydrogenase
VTTKKPVLGLTIGDPAGIGPEISLRVAALPEIQQLCRLVLIGDACVLEAARGAAKVDGPIMVFPGEGLQAILQAEPRAGVIELLNCGVLNDPPPLALPSEEGGIASYTAIMTAIHHAKAGLLSGVVTAPISKLSWSLAGVNRVGHTEVFGEETGSDPYAMLMYSERLAVGLVTCHQSLFSVPESLTVERIVAVGRLLSESVQRLRGTKPRIAVLGLNPHAGEAGLFGLEETMIVGPAVSQLRAEGIDADGPLPPDTAFTTKMRDRFQAFLCMYHDQGLIPFKMISFDDGVNVTMGLPFVRTSVDHGTAYDLAGRGVAEIGSLIAAVKLAVKLAS